MPTGELTAMLTANRTFRLRQPGQIIEDTIPAAMARSEAPLAAAAAPTPR